MNMLMEERLHHINVDNLINYVVEHNWKEFKTKKDGICIFQYEEEDNFYEITIPLDTGFSDYYDTLYRSIYTICKKDKLNLNVFINYLSKNHDPIYAITCFEQFEERILKDGRPAGFPDYGAMVFMGFYHDFDDATESVIENNCDINERCYNYAVIEEISPGLYAYPRPRWFYKFNYDTNNYEPIGEPDFMKHNVL